MTTKLDEKLRVIASEVRSDLALDCGMLHGARSLPKALREAARLGAEAQREADAQKVARDLRLYPVSYVRASLPLVTDSKEPSDD